MRAPDDTQSDGDAPSDGDAVDRWGATAMPAWLDDGAPRARPGASPFEVLDDDLDLSARDRAEFDWAEFDRDENHDVPDDEWDEPRRRWTMLPRAAMGLVAVGLIACVFAGYTLLRENEPTAPLVSFDEPAASTASVPGSPPATPVPSTAADLVVSVVGLVKRPGLVRMPTGARVADAIDEAGGARDGADLLSLNLAQLLHDGDQILIGRSGGGQVRSAVVSSSPSGTAAPTGGSDETTAAQSGKVNLNTATEAQLDELPGVGPVTAQAIIAWREAHGGFASVSQLADVDGIGPSRLAKLTPLVTVG